MNLRRCLAWPVATLLILALVPFWEACSSSSTNGTGGTTNNNGTGGTSAGTGGSSNGSGGGSSTATGTGGSTAALTGPVLGTFTVTLVEATAGTTDVPSQAAQTSFVGTVYNAEYPSSVWSSVLEDGGCQVLTVTTPSCNPSCGGTGLCVTADHCVTYPTAQDVGVVTVEGMGSTITTTVVSGIYQVGTKLPYPPATEGAASWTARSTDHAVSFVCA